MAFTFGFYNALEGDRVYDARDFNKLFDGLITDGIFATIGEAMAVVPGEGMAVIVKTGKAWFNRTWNINDTYMTLRISTADPVRPRYDAVVLEVDAREESRRNSIKIIKGTVAVNPVYPTLTNSGDLHQYPLAYVRVNAGATSIPESSIVPMVGQSPCPFVTGILETVDITDLFVQWNGEFHDWFDAIQADLEGNVVTNLLHRIEEVDKKANASIVFESEFPNYYLWGVGTSELGLFPYDDAPFINNHELYSASDSSTAPFTVVICSNVKVNEDGTFTYIGKQTVSINRYNGQAQFEALKGKFYLIDRGDFPTSILKPDSDVKNTLRNFYFIPTDATFTIKNNYIEYDRYKWGVFISKVKKGGYFYKENILKYISTKTSSPPSVPSGQKAIPLGQGSNVRVICGRFDWSRTGETQRADVVFDTPDFRPKMLIGMGDSSYQCLLLVRGDLESKEIGGAYETNTVGTVFTDSKIILLGYGETLEAFQNSPGYGIKYKAIAVC